MSKDLPYFRFYPSEWTGGRIFTQTVEMKGYFIDILCRYWKNKSIYSYEEACLDFNKEIIDWFIEKRIIAKENDYLVINFMNEQVQEIEKDKKKKSKAGKASAKSRYVKPVEHLLDSVEQKSTPVKECSANNINNNISISNSNNKNKRFIKPTLSEIKQYILEQNYSVNSEQFFNFYESKGWLIGKNPMKDWRAAVRTWHSKNNPESIDNQPRAPAYPDCNTCDNKGWDMNTDPVLPCSCEWGNEVKKRHYGKSEAKEFIGKLEEQTNGNSKN